MFITLLFKLGICQCVVKGMCKMSCAACAMYWLAIGEMIRCLWHSLRNTKRVYRRKRLRDIEAGSYDYASDVEPSSSNSLSPTQKNIRPKRGRRRRRGSKHNQNRGSNRRLTRLRSRQMSVRVQGISRRVKSARKMKSSRVRVKKILKVKHVVD
ncbi:unnamed protein product [Thlaspi arvense]|uniref:Uncharacterized protein n=1 Tax=Thlaspi arvense TaxID=13288 RepID=A0AAU9SJV1_THLAR|nr:unnamed protein product [Thlaspi arvense]